MTQFGVMVKGRPRTLLTAAERNGQPADSALAWALVLGRYRDHGVAVTGSVEVGVDFPQSGELEPCAQFADREGTERDHMFVWLNLAAGLEDEHQMGDVLVAEAVRYLPGIEHQASSPPRVITRPAIWTIWRSACSFSQLRESTTTCPPGRAIRRSPVSASLRDEGGAMAWRLDGTYFESCSCDAVCPCTWSALTAKAHA